MRRELQESRWCALAYAIKPRWVAILKMAKSSPSSPEEDAYENPLRLVIDPGGFYCGKRGDREGRETKL